MKYRLATSSFIIRRSIDFSEDLRWFAIVINEDRLYGPSKIVRAHLFDDDAANFDKETMRVFAAKTIALEQFLKIAHRVARGPELASVVECDMNVAVVVECGIDLVSNLKCDGLFADRYVESIHDEPHPTVPRDADRNHRPKLVAVWFVSVTRRTSR